MMLDWNAIVPAIVVGMFASLILPFVNWRIERIRLRHQSRKEKIQDWRSQLEKAKTFSDIQRTLLWEELKPHLTEAEQEFMFATVLVMGNSPSGEEQKLSKLFEIVAKVQKEWKIV